MTRSDGSVTLKTSMRWIALLVLFAVLPTAELVEQVAHLVEHTLELEAADHSAHHDDSEPGDEHGCTGLVHLCACHHAQVNLASSVTVTMRVGASPVPDTEAPSSLVDLTTREPAQRPPIA